MSETFVETGVAQVRGLLAALVEAPLFGLSDGDKVSLLEDLGRLRHQVDEVFLRIVGEVDACNAGLAETGARSTQQLLAGRLRMTPPEAHKAVKLARALARPESAPVSAGLAAGAFSAEHAHRIVQAVAALPDDLASAARRQARDDLVDYASRFNPADLSKLGRRILDVIDPELADRELAKQLERDERQAMRERTLWFQDAGHDNGSVRFGGRLDAASAEILRTALDPLAKPVPGEGRDRDLRSHGQRQADALVELASRVLRAGTLPKHGGEPTQVVVTMRYDDLAKGVNAAYLPTGQAISASQARLLACDANIIPAVLDSASVPVDIGRGKRCYEGKRRKALDLRDGGCAFPGCDTPSAWCDAHHILPWWSGGPTNLDNGVLLCRFHHHLIHQGHWTIHLGPDRRPEFTPPPWIDPIRHPLRQPRPHWTAAA